MHTHTHTHAHTHTHMKPKALPKRYRRRARAAELNPVDDLLAAPLFIVTHVTHVDDLLAAPLLNPIDDVLGRLNLSDQGLFDRY
jgi:hypothetical protein